MGFSTVTIDFSLQKEDFVRMLLLDGTVKISSPEGELTLTGARNHMKTGTPGEEDGSNHFFDTIATLNNRIDTNTCVRVRSEDGGNTYVGSLSMKIYPADNMSE